VIRIEPHDSQGRHLDQSVLQLYENRKPLRESEFGPIRSHRTLKAVAGGIVFVLMMIGLVMIVAWIVNLAARRRRVRQATA
jgi:hypothetical protein